MKIKISAESTIDMPKNLLEKFNIYTVPFTVIMGDKEYFDGEFPNSQIFDFVKNTKKLPKTSAVNKYQYEEHFKNLKEDCDIVIHISLSSEISCAYANAKEVAKDMENVYVIDSRTLSTGIALLSIKASELAQKGESAENIIKTIEQTIPKVQASFVLDKLQYLVKGGRCSALTAFGANLLSIKPQIVVKDGKMQVGKKYVGNFENSTKKYYKDTLAQNQNCELDYAFITYTTASESLIEYARDCLEEKGFKNILVTQAGATITSHCGPNTLGILFINS